MKILIIEDEADIREVIREELKMRHFEVEELENGNPLFDKLREFGPDVILMDQMMPGKTGLDLTHEIRNHPDFKLTPIIFLTALDGEDEIVKALESGADDYITKPFSTPEMVARIQAVVRRSRPPQDIQPDLLSWEELSIDLNSYRVFLRGKEIPLTLTEYKILCELIRHGGRVLTRDTLREKALGHQNVTDRTIDVHMASIRKKLTDYGLLIETVRGVGYRIGRFDHRLEGGS